MDKVRILEKYPWPKELLRAQGRIVEAFIEIPLKSSAQEIWYWLSDSSRINRALGMAHRDEVERDGHLIVSTKMLGQKQEWKELPWKWVSGESIIVDRIYNKGFAKTNHSIFYFNDNKLYIYMGFIPNGYFSKILLDLGGKSVVQDLAKLLLEIDEDLYSGKIIPQYFAVNEDKLNNDAKEILNKKLSKAMNLGLPESIMSNVYELICSGDELDLYRIRTKELALKWNIDYKQLLEYFILLSHCEILYISWDIICPSCLGPRTQTKELVDLLNIDHCPSCKINFETSSENSIEITFKINEKIRRVKQLQFCAAQPARKRHIKIQWSFSSKDKWKELNLAQGQYRIRLLGDANSSLLNISPTGEQQCDMNESKDHYHLAPLFKLVFPKISSKETLIIEELELDPMALRPRDLFAQNIFKRFFKNQDLGDGVQLHLGEQTILFTDIISSTKFYEGQGDKKAFEYIKDHFKELYTIFESHHGIIIKTIGDAVMASFPTPENALSATKEMHQVFDSSHTKFPFQLRASAHIGNVIGVNQDTGIDYFGNTVNVAAKLQAIAEDQQLGVSKEFFDQLSQASKKGWNITHKEIQLPGKKTITPSVILSLEN